MDSTVRWHTPTAYTETGIGKQFLFNILPSSWLPGKCLKGTSRCRPDSSCMPRPGWRPASTVPSSILGSRRSIPTRRVKWPSTYTFEMKGTVVKKCPSNCRKPSVGQSTNTDWRRIDRLASKIFISFMSRNLPEVLTTTVLCSSQFPYCMKKDMYVNNLAPPDHLTAGDKTNNAKDWGCLVSLAAYFLISNYSITISIGLVLMIIIMFGLERCRCTCQ